MNFSALVDLALAAGREIMAVRAAGFAAETKSDGSLVTLADRRAEAVIERGLQALAPDIPMIGEEAVAAGRIPECGQLFFCVDPLDGTRGFSKGGDHFTVNIALVSEGLPTHGVVYAPASGELYAGEPGAAFSARCDIATAQLRAPLAPIRVQGSPTKPMRAIASEGSMRDTRAQALITALGAEPTYVSSSIKFCRIAEGAADLYPRFGEVSEWDAAAGHAILRAAGGDIVSLDGAPLFYGDHSDGFLIKGFFAYGGEHAKQAALAAIA
jgi:3'(2'),5'-bisphosphate nucleotidase